MRKILSLAVVFMIALAARATAPDFAFPKKVEQTAKTTLKKALKNNDYPEATRALMNIVLAQSEVDNNTLNGSVSLLETTYGETQDSVFKGMLMLLEAQILKDVYVRKRYFYDQRNLPLNPYPEDIFEYSGDQFKTRICSLLDSLQQYYPALETTSIERWSSVVDYSQDQLPLYPTLAQFAIGRSSEIATSLGGYNAFPARMYAPDYGGLKASDLSLEKDRIIYNNYKALLRAAGKNSLLQVAAEVGRLKWVYDYNHSRNEYRTALLDLYKKYEGDPVSALVLVQLPVPDDEKEAVFAWNLTEDYISRFHEDIYRKEIESFRKSLKTESATLSYPPVVSPSVPVSFELSVANMSKVTVEIYKITSNLTAARNLSSVNKKDLNNLVKTVIFEFDNSRPFEKDTVFKVSLPDYAIYTAKIREAKDTARYRSYPTLTISDIYLSAIYPVTGQIFATARNIVTGAPLEGVLLHSYYYGDSISTTKTGQDGWGVLSDKGNKVFPSKGADRYSSPVGYHKIPWQQTDKVDVTIQTSLPVYHPGDSLKFVGILAKNGRNVNEILPGEPLKYIAQDVNYQVVDSATVVTDDFGRLYGGCKLPTEGITGSYHIQIQYKNRTLNSRNFMVSDYKLPTFSVTLSQVTDSTTTDITLKGSAVAYSGFPVADSPVSISIMAESPARYFMYSDQPEQVSSLTATTDAQGNFVVKVPRKNLSSRKYYGKGFKAVASVTTASDETRDASCWFSVSTPYYFEITKSLTSYDLSSGVPFYKVCKIGGDSVSLPAVVEIQKDNRTLLTLRDYDFKPLAKLPTSNYTVKITAMDTTLAKTFVESDCFMYNPEIKEFNVDKILWTPKNWIETESEVFEILLGTSEDTLYIEQLITDGEKVISRNWFNLNKGLVKHKVTLPENLKNGFLHLTTVRNSRGKNIEFTLINKKVEKKLNLTFSSFRNRTLSGSTETWEIKTRFNGSEGAEAAIVLDVLSKAIVDNFGFEDLDLYRSGNMNDIGIYNQSVYPNNVYYNGSRVNVDNPFAGVPSFNTYGISWTGNSRQRLMTRNGVMIRGAGMVKEESAEAEEVADMACATMTVNYSSAKVALSAVELEAESGSDSDAGGVSDKLKGKEPEVSYRQSEVPLALFAPELKTDKDGNLKFTFTLPDATTTWSIMSTAFTKDCYSANDRREITASKPVMVQTAAPRFLRAGDAAVLKSAIMNAAGKNLEKVRITTEVLNASATEVLATKSVVLDIAAGEKAVVEIPFEVPEDIAGAVLRTSAVAMEYTDGEQASFPVLPASEKVIESTPFHIPADSTSITLTVDNGAGMTSSLEFCENAVWTVVQALPGLSARENLTAPDAASAIFSGAVAEGLIRKNPVIATTLKRMVETQRNDSTALANLMNNEDVRLAVLAATPWMQDAMSDSERIARLALLFSGKEIERNYKTNLNTLAKLVRKNGWGWSASSTEASRWATESVLKTFAILRQIGYLPDDAKLNKMIDNALSWLDADVAKSNSKLSRPNISADYTYIRSVFKSGYIPSGARKTISATVKYMVENGLSMSPEAKAQAAVILEMNGYSSTANTLLKSLEEFSTASAQGEVSWKNVTASGYNRTSDIVAAATILDAYSMIHPSDKIIDGIRLWLINEKSRRDWGTSSSTSMVIASILKSGSDWTSPKVARSAIRINGGEPLTYTPTDIATGYFRTRLPDGRLTISIDKVGNYPAYGAVYSSGTRALDEIKPVSLPDLSITKVLYVKEDGKWVKPAGALKAGERVKVVLTINSGVDLSYVMITDNRAACLEPVDQQPGYVYSQSLGFYKEPRNSATNIFIDFMPRGIYMLEEEYNVDRDGTYSSGTAALQSQYAPAYSVRSGAERLTVE